MTGDSGRVGMGRQVALYLEWGGFYADDTGSPQVVVEKGVVVDMNQVALSAGVYVGMRLQHVLPLVPGCQVKAFEESSERQSEWLDLVVPYSSVIEPVAGHIALVDLGAHPDPVDIAKRVVSRLCGQRFGRLTHGMGESTWLARLAALQGRPYDYLGDAGAVLRGQSVDSLLCLTQGERERMKALGLPTVGAVQSVRMSVLKRQFGDRAGAVSLGCLGRGGGRVRAVYPAASVTESVWFGEPVNCELALMREIDGVAGRLAEKSAGKQASSATLRVELDGGAERSVSRDYKRPVGSAERTRVSLRYLAQGLLAGAVDVVRVTAHLEGLEPVRSSQTSFFVSGGGGGSLPVAAVSGLQSALGAGSVVLASEVEMSRRSQVLKAWRDATGWS